MFDQEKQKGQVGHAVRSIVLKVMSIVFLYFALLHWAVLIGLTGDGFVQLGNDQRLYNLALAVFFPIISFALWAGLGWGLVLWGAVCVLLLAISQLVAIDLDTARHTALLVLLLIFSGAELARKRLFSAAIK